MRLTELEVYQLLLVPEVWVYRQGQLTLYILSESGYGDGQGPARGQRPTSLAFPTVDVKALLPQYVERAWAAGSSVALREFEQYLQTDS